MAKNERTVPTLIELRDLSDMPPSEPMTDEVVDAMADEFTALVALKKRLPMLYTPRGNIIRRPAPRITAKAFFFINEQIKALETRDTMIVVHGETWHAYIGIAESNLLRDLGQITPLVIAGWVLNIKA